MSTLLTSNEIAERFKVSPHTVYTWRKRGLLRAYKLGGGAVRFEEADVQQFMNDSRGRGTA